MRRRDFISLFSGAAAAWPLAARAQQPATPVVGFMGVGSPDDSARRVNAFRRGLSEEGYVEGQSVTVEYRWAEGRYERLPLLAADLVHRHVALITAVGGAASGLAAKAATSAIPIVFVLGVDPVKIGLVSGINRPGGNVTGVTLMLTELMPKRLQLLREVVPNVTAVGVLVNPANGTTEFQIREAQQAARALGWQIVILNASREREFDTAFAKLNQERVGALVVGSDGFFYGRSAQLGALSEGHKIPAIYETREFTAAGGLMSYGPDFPDAYRQAGIYAGKILRGAKPAELPVQQATKVELIINFNAARTFGLSIPLPLLGRADEVIE